MRKKISFKEIISVVLSVSICVGIFLYVRSGSLTPPGAPGSTMFSLSDIVGAGFASTTHSLVQIKTAVNNLGSSCPAEIESADRAAATLANAVTTCRNLGGNWRLPTAEEISCFIGIASASTGYLWTRSPSYGTYSPLWVYVRLTDGGWSDYLYSLTAPFRCVR